VALGLLLAPTVLTARRLWRHEVPSRPRGGEPALLFGALMAGFGVYGMRYESHISFDAFAYALDLVTVGLLWWIRRYLRLPGRRA
jgi:hypothetical protein